MQRTKTNKKTVKARNYFDLFFLWENLCLDIIKIIGIRRGSRNFSRGGGDFRKKNLKKVCLPHFRSTKLIF